MHEFTLILSSCRWDINEIDRLPDYMKISYKAILDLYKDYEKELSSAGRSHIVCHAIERVCSSNLTIEIHFFLNPFLTLVYLVFVF